MSPVPVRFLLRFPDREIQARHKGPSPIPPAPGPTCATAPALTIVTSATSRTRASCVTTRRRARKMAGCGLSRVGVAAGRPPSWWISNRSKICHNSPNSRKLLMTIGIAVWHWKGDVLPDNSIDELAQRLKRTAPRVTESFRQDQRLHRARWRQLAGQLGQQP